MAIELELRERQKSHLAALLQIKKHNEGVEVKYLPLLIEAAIATMSQDDLAWVEKVVGVKAL